jgi:hypothetical protein
MIIIQSQPQKEVMAVDADDHLRRLLLFRFNFSENAFVPGASQLYFHVRHCPFCAA